MLSWTGGRSGNGAPLAQRLADPGRPWAFPVPRPHRGGKTELAKALAEALFGDEDRMIRLDMSEFQEAHTASRLVGSPPGYVGYDKAGQFTEQVRRKPYSVILLDEVEKAHPDVFNVLLQVLEDGRLTDSQGRTVSFRNTVLILTSNLGSDIVSQRSGILGFSSRDQEQAEGPAREKIMDRLRESFRPEFLNRIDEIVVFRKLDSGQLAQITELLLDNTRRRLRAQGIEIEFSRSAVDWQPSTATSPSSAPVRCAGPSNAKWTIRSRTCCSAESSTPGRVAGQRSGRGTVVLDAASKRGSGVVVDGDRVGHRRRLAGQHEPVGDLGLLQGEIAPHVDLSGGHSRPAGPHTRPCRRTAGRDAPAEPVQDRHVAGQRHRRLAPVQDDRDLAGRAVHRGLVFPVHRFRRGGVDEEQFGVDLLRCSADVLQDLLGIGDHAVRTAEPPVVGVSRVDHRGQQGADLLRVEPPGEQVRLPRLSGKDVDEFEPGRIAVFELGELVREHDRVTPAVAVDQGHRGSGFVQQRAGDGQDQVIPEPAAKQTWC